MNRKCLMLSQIQHIQIILYVNNQAESCEFYKALFRKAPDLDVPGMTEFRLSETLKIGLMPNNGIAKILSDKMPHPETGHGIPRCELYLMTDNAESEYRHALRCGAKPVSAVRLRDWGDRAGYLSDPDGHVIVFADRNY